MRAPPLEAKGARSLFCRYLRLVYKPHFVRRVKQVYAGRSTLRLGAKLRPCCSLQRSSIYAVYPRLAIPTNGDGRSGPLHRLCLTLLPTGVAWPPTLL